VVQSSVLPFSEIWRTGPGPGPPKKGVQDRTGPDLKTLATMLLFLFGGQVPRHYVNSHEGEGIARVRLYVSKVGRPLRLFCPVFVIFKGPLESLQGSLHNCKLRAYFDVGLSSSCIVLQRRYHPLMQVINLLEAEAILGEVPSDHKWRRHFIGRFRPRGCATWHDYPPLLLDNSSVLSQDCEQPCKTAAPTITVGIILEMRGEVPLEDESSEPLISRGLLVLGVSLFMNPSKFLCAAGTTQMVDEVAPFSDLISPARSSLWQSVVLVGGAIPLH